MSRCPTQPSDAVVLVTNQSFTSMAPCVGGALAETADALAASPSGGSVRGRDKINVTEVSPKAHTMVSMKKAPCKCGMS